jgi:hypothetical protein
MLFAGCIWQMIQLLLYLHNGKRYCNKCIAMKKIQWDSYIVGVTQICTIITIKLSDQKINISMINDPFVLL